MGQTDTEAIVQIEQTRRRLDSELEELATYLPPTTARVKRSAAILAGVDLSRMDWLTYLLEESS